DDDDDQEVEKNDDKDDAKESRDDEEEGRGDELEFDEEETNEETRDEESFDPIPQTPESSEDEGDGEEDQRLNVEREEGLNEKEEEDELYIDVNINQGRGLQETLEVEDTHVTLTLVNPDGQSFAELPFEEEILDFIRFFRQSETIRTLIDININKLYQPWRSFAAIINKCLTGKTSGYDSLRLSQAQILWGLYHKRNVDYAFLIWEDFVFQVEHKNQKKSNEMYYPRFIKVIIHHFMSKDPSISQRNKVNWHYVRDDFMFSTIKLVSRHQNTQQFGALLPIELTNEEIRNSKAYKEYYAIATGEAAPKPKASARRTRSGSNTSIAPSTAAVTPRLTTATKQIHISQPSGSSADEGTGSKPRVPDVPTDKSKEELSWNFTDDEGADDEGKDGDDDEEDDVDENKDGDEKDDADEYQEVAKHDDKDDTEENRDDDEEGGSDEHEYNEETWEEESFDPIPQTPKDSEDESDGEEDLCLNIGGEERHDEEEEENELYRDVNINQGRGLQGTLEVEDTHVTLTPVKLDGMESIFETTSRIDVQTHTSVAPLPITTPTMTSSTIATTTQTSQAPTLPTIIMSEAVNEQLEAEVLTRLSHSSITSYAVAADLFEMELKKILIEKMEGNKSIQRSDEQRNLYKALVDAYESDKIILDTYRESVTLKRRRNDDEDKDEEPSARPDLGQRDAEKASASESAFAEEPVQTTSQIEEPFHLEFETAVHESIQPWISELAKQADTRSSFNELMDTALNFSNFIMNRLRVDTLTPKLLAGPTYDLVKGLCKSLIELEYHLEEVYKATTDQLDWVNPEGQQYPHNLLHPLPLIPDNRGHRVIPFAHFINNDLKYLRGGASSRKYTTSVTKTKAADYGHIKWIEDLFYGFVVNQESARDVYSKRRIITVTELKIVEWHSYKHLDWITVRRDDDKLYKFKEGDFKRLRIQDIEDISIVIQRRMEDLQLGVESYQKKLNLTKPDTYRSNLKRKEAYTAYSNLWRFIYQNKDKQNRLMRIDELHKFSNGKLTDVRTALDDRLKGIWMQYLPQTI
nr:hypothetical protein [Tanacetum cinerariifolium]